MYQPLVSVMIPFYNNQDTIQRCLDSVVALTYRPLEVLLIDDAGSDHSVCIVRDFISRHSEDDSLSIRLISQPENRGLAAARIRAIDEASGEYFTAIDADDYIEPEAITEYIKATDSGKFDMVASGIIYQYPTHSEKHLYKQGEALTLHDATINAMHFSFANKLIRTACLKSIDLFIPGQDSWEDLGAVSRLLASGISVTVLNEAFYHYVQYNPDSLTKYKADHILHQHIIMARSVEQWMSQRGLDSENQDFLTYLKFIAKVKYLRNPPELLRHPLYRLRAWRNTFPEVNSRILSLRHLPLHYRLMFFTARLLSAPL